MLKKLMKSILAGTGITLLLAALLPAAPAAAEDVAWTEAIIPSTSNHVLGPAGVDVRDLAVYGSDTFYAAPGDSVAASVIYKSTSGGTEWQAVSTAFQADLVAVSPSNANTVAIADSATGQVNVSTDGGATWYDLGKPQQSGGDIATAVYGLAISPVTGGNYYLAAAGTDISGANIWYYNLGTAAPSWQETKAADGFSHADQAATVAFSPDFASDKTLLAITEEDGVAVRLQLFKESSGEWNSTAGFAAYPLNIISGGSVVTLDAASISPAPTFDASSSGSRNAFVGLALSGGGGIYRIKQDALKALKTNAGIRSIAYNGSRLVAGDYANSRVYRSNSPMASAPIISSVAATKAPGGTGPVVLAWAGSSVAAGTSGDESAFAVSGDYGNAFNDIGLIDTSITSIRDFAVSANGKTAYMVSTDASHLSLWRKTTAQNNTISWARVYNLNDNADYIVRTPPGNTTTVYLGKKGNKTIYQNQQSGDDAWTTRNCSVNIRDMAVADADSIYVLNAGGSVTESHNGGQTWSTPMLTGLGSGAAIYSLDMNNLAVGSQNGYVAYSTNGNDSWTVIEDAIEAGAGNVQVIISGNSDEGRIIYAASDSPGGNILRWSLDNSNDWTDIVAGNIPGGIYGLAIEGGKFYALEFNAVTEQSTLWRHLSPAAAKAEEDTWSRSTTSSTTDATDSKVHFNLTPRALKVSEGRVWTVKTNGTNKLYYFSDVTITIEAGNPAQGFVITVNPISGAANNVAFSWPSPSDAVTEYELEIARDRDFFVTIVRTTIASNESSVSAVVGPTQTGDRFYNFFAGTTYYWRVRATQPVYSPYSEVRSFSVEPVAATHAPGILTPANGSTTTSARPAFSWSPVSGAAGYNIVLGTDVDLTEPIIDITVDKPALVPDEELTPGTYFWRVRSAENADSVWSALAHFIVEEPAPAAGGPAAIFHGPGEIKPPQVTPGVVTIPPPVVEPAPLIPDSIFRFTIYFGLALALGLLIIILRTTGPFRIPADWRSRLRGLGGDLLNNLRNPDLRRRLRLRGPALPAPAAPAAAVAKAADTATAETPVAPDAAKAEAVDAAVVDAAVADVAETGRSIAFAVESFLWMTQEERGDGQRMLSPEETRQMGENLAAKIAALAGQTLLHVSFPRDTAVFLRIWALYGSRKATNRYLTDTFRARPESVTTLLRCYLPADAGAEAQFGQAQYDTLAESVDTAEVYKALTGIYGNQLSVMGDTGASPERTIAARFARIHLALQSATPAPQKAAGANPE